MTIEGEQPKLTGIDRKLQILNGIVAKVREYKDPFDRAMFADGFRVWDLITEEEYHELLEIGTAQQEFDAALAGVEIGDPRELPDYPV